MEILWTGGFDSSFRMVQLSRQPVTVQPYYIRAGRRSEGFELGAVNRIRAMLLARPETAADIREPVVLDKGDIAVPQDIQEAARSLFQKFGLKSQYEWLAAFARAHPGVEAGIAKMGVANRTMAQNGGTCAFKDERGGTYYAISPDAARDVLLLFDNFRYPILDVSKLDMRAEYIRLGYADVMEATWFCHHPFRGRPCGVCGPCTQTIAEGMPERFGKAALRRARHREPWRLALSGHEKLTDIGRRMRRAGTR